MKTFHIIIVLLSALRASGQTEQWNLQPTEAEQALTRAYPLEITTNKTSSIIFPAVIKSVDRGSRDILAQKAKEVSNVLHVKAGRERFDETNLTVITADGVLYHFTVRYMQDPGVLTFDMAEVAGENDPNRSVTDRSKLLFAAGITETQMGDYCRAMVGSRRLIYFKKRANNKVNFSLLGIYIKDDVIFYRLKIRNRSNIDYDVDLLKFYIRDNARIKRTASQEVQARVVYRFGESVKVVGKSETELIYALEKFTIPEAKHVAIELMEKNGGRHYALRVKNKSIVRAKVL